MWAGRASLPQSWGPARSTDVCSLTRLAFWAGRREALLRQPGGRVGGSTPSRQCPFPMPARTSPEEGGDREGGAPGMRLISWGAGLCTGSYPPLAAPFLR